MKAFLALLFLHSCLVLKATDIEISNCVLADNRTDKQNPIITVQLTVSWKNAWKNARNHDAAWIFFKLKAAQEGRSQLHGIVKATGCRLIRNFVTGSPLPSFEVPADGAGIFVFPSATYRGNISWRIELQLDVARIKNLDMNGLAFVYPQAMEMVHIPKGSFYLGEADSAAQKNSAAFFEAGTGSYYHVQSENAVEISNSKGNLWYNNNNEAVYKGDMKGVLPAAFPKGFNGFYIMKYEMTDGEYAAFLNSIGDYWTSQRANFGGRKYYEYRGSIYFEEGQYKTKSPGRPASFTSWDDECAFADWAGLRPMTELEYEKACRGTQKPTLSNDFPWGGNSREKVNRYYNSSNDLVNHPSLDESLLDDSNLEMFGASFYWVMDLNKSVWERCVSVGTEKGRSFEGTHGDGMPGGYYGNATNSDWPNGYDGKGGLGYRGGGTYQKGMVGSPEGRVAERSFAAWGDGPRDIAYGFRAARTAE